MQELLPSPTARATNPPTVLEALQLLLLGQPHAAAPELAQHAVAGGAGWRLWRSRNERM